MGSVCGIRVGGGAIVKFEGDVKITRRREKAMTCSLCGERFGVGDTVKAICGHGEDEPFTHLRCSWCADFFDDSEIPFFSTPGDADHHMMVGLDCKWEEPPVMIDEVAKVLNLPNDLRDGFARRFPETWRLVAEWRDAVARNGEP